MNLKQESKDSNNNIVYKYTNSVNSKVYIGRTMRSIEARAGSNGSGYKTCPKFWHAICKYGWDKFTLEILAEELSYEDSVKLEEYYIQHYQSNKQQFGYNILAQEPNRGSIPKEVRDKISEAKKHLTAEQRKRIGEAHLGKAPWNKGIKTGPMSDAARKNFSKARRHNKNSIHVPVRNVTTGEVFRSGAEAGRSIGCTSEAVLDSIKRSRPCKGYVFERIHE